MGKRKVIVFDMDGVIFDSPRLAAEHMKASYPGLTDAHMQEMLKENFHEAIKKIPFPKMEQTEEEKVARKKQYSEAKAKVPMYPGIQEMLGRLAKDYCLVINTSAWERNTLPLLENNKISQYFSFIATGEVHTSKAEKFKIIAEKFGIKLPEVIFVTDTVGDVREAEEAHVPTILVTWGVHSEEDFGGKTPSNFIAVAHTPSELEAIIVKGI